MSKQSDAAQIRWAYSKKLFGKVVWELEITPDRQLILLLVSEAFSIGDPGGQRHKMGLMAQADVNNSVFFEHISGLDKLVYRGLPGLGYFDDFRIKEVVPKGVSREGDDFAVFVWSIVAGMGSCDIEVRNSFDYPYSGEVSIVKPKDVIGYWTWDELKEVKEDF